ncbi:helix-turn-helix domain-containing protein [Fictibacillus barbaricus]|uniref:Helix-turn-helix domain-containing protein n=1 Tax=Fictibacillus barbaricus TaxID=182136 RepID=A0ABS2ZEL6_9BACL|nr:RodZ domain-containing protein [Fictibacillus barbaricus]MBN3545777.1 helix-turn-helix domain-containing protein [Fictibacillus barbaricus]GGB55982.1 transcriptional regulator [Fictibacillus barbaricus]
MTELGKFLREKREEKGMSLEELQTATKIQKRYLVAIEEGNYDVLPGAFYARAFIKNYCEAVGLHYETIFDDYAHEIPKSAKEPVTEFEPRSKRERTGVAEENTLLKRLVPVFLIGVLIIVILFIVWKLLPDGNDEAKSDQSDVKGIEVVEDKDKPKKKEEPKQEEEQKEEPAEKEEVQKQTLTKVETNGKVTTYDLTNTDKLVVELTATGDSYVGIQDETKKSYFDSQIKKGQTETFDLSVAKEVTLNIGASHVTSVKINGEAFTYPVPPSELVHQKIVIRKAQ